MDLGFTEQQELLKNAARDFLEQECPEQLVRDMEEDDRGYSAELWSQMAEQGWQGLLIPEEYDGAGFDFLDLCVLLEEFGRALVPGPFMSSVLGGAVPLMGGRLRRPEVGLPAAYRLRRPDLHARADRALRPLRRAGHRGRGDRRRRRGHDHGHEAVRPGRQRRRLHGRRGALGERRDAGDRGHGPARRDGQPAAHDRARQAVRGDPRRREGAAAG